MLDSLIYFFGLEDGFVAVVKNIVRRLAIRLLSILFFPFFLAFFLFSTTISYLHGKEHDEFYDFTTGARFFKFLVWNLIILGGRE